MERQQANSLQNFEDSKSDILKKRLLKSAATPVSSNPAHHTSQNNVLLNTIRTPASGSMLMQAPQSSLALGPGPGGQPLGPARLAGGAGYPLQLSTVHVPVQLPGSCSNISVPVQLGPLAGDSGPLPAPTIQMPSMPLLHNPGVSAIQLMDSNQVKMSSAPSHVQVCGSGAGAVVVPGTPVTLRGSARPVPHMVYIQTPAGLKPVSSSEVITQASSSGNPPQIIVRRPVSSNNSNILISNTGIKPNIAPKVAGQKTSILAPGPAQPIVIQKPKPSDKVIGPVTIAQGQGKQAFYLSSVKKKSENQSILISNNQNNNGSQKLFLTPMNMPKMQQNAKFILPVTLPATMASKGPIINLQIANGQIQNDPQGNSITVMRETVSSEASDMPPLQPLAKSGTNGREGNSVIPQSPKSDKSFTMSIPGSRAEPTGEQGEYTLSIPETNASLNDDVYTVSIADENGTQRENSFTLAIPEKGKSLLNRNVVELPAPPTILRRSNSEHCDRRAPPPDHRRRVSLCTDLLSHRPAAKLPLSLPRAAETPGERPEETNDDHRVPSLFCDEKLEEVKTAAGDSDAEEYKDCNREADAEKRTEVEKQDVEKRDPNYYFQKMEKLLNKERVKRVTVEAGVAGVEPPELGLQWRGGVGRLPGSQLSFHTNEFGIIDLLEHGDPDEGAINAKYQTPLKQRAERSHPKKATSPEDMYRCDGCGCHGMAAEFITPNYCSVQCQSDVLKSTQRRRDRERADLAKRRNRVKKLLMRRQPSESDPARDYEGLPPEPPRIEEFVENEKYPWMCGKSGFSWMRYLDHCKAKAAPVKLFKDPFPYGRNGFKVGMRMEAIDPSHPALFCVVSVAEVQGYRLRLHFDEYPDVYDYWVNADCPDLFPCGWCERQGRPLTPPAGYSPATFSWPFYLKQLRAVAAPKYLFPHLAAPAAKPAGFRVGMKLEAEDRSNDLVCVATVADLLDGRLRVSFDSWDECYDLWAEPGSPAIHPVGWAQDHGVPLTPPNYYKEPESFSWEAYLAETGAQAAPARAFKTRPPQGFKPGMKLEVVDPRVPFLIRVATVSMARGHRVRVSCDGWGSRLAAWRDDDCPDLHPVGWCLKTQHPLEPPLTAEDMSAAGPCGVAGCRGLGSTLRGPHKVHSLPQHCPYSARPEPPPDRLQPRSPHRTATARIPAKQLANLHPSTPTNDLPKGVHAKAGRGRPPKHKRLEQVAKNDISDDESLSSGAGGKRWRSSLSPAPLRTYSRHVERRSHESVQRSHESASRSHESASRSHESARRSPEPERAQPPPRLRVERIVAELGLPDSPLEWTESDVLSAVEAVAGAAARCSLEAGALDGRALAMVSARELRAAGLPLGPALKVTALRDCLRARLLAPIAADNR